MRTKWLARIVHEDEALYLPAGSPYEVETLFEQVAWYARLYGRVGLELNERLIDVEGSATLERCVACDGPLTIPRFREGGRPLCIGCVGPALFPGLLRLGARRTPRAATERSAEHDRVAPRAMRGSA